MISEVADMSIPSKFNPQGLLEPSTYEAILAELRTSLLVWGDGSSPSWDSSWRKELVKRVEVLIGQLWEVRVFDIYLNGSFVENKDHPHDIDGYFDPHLSMDKEEDMNQFERIILDLNNLDPQRVWTWVKETRRSYSGYGKKQLPMWHFYRVELYPHLNQDSGIKDIYGNPLRFPSAFRQCRATSEPKGIIKIIPEGGF